MYYVLYSFSLLALSQSSVIIRWSQTEALTLGAWRLLFAGLLLWIWTLYRQPRVAILREDSKKIVVAGFAFFIHLFSYAYSAHHTTIAHVMLIYSINPVSTALGSFLFFNERLTARQIVAYLLAVLGIYLLAREHQGGAVSLEGDLMALLSALTFSVYALMSQSVRRRMPNAIFASRLYIVAAAFFFIAGLYIRGPHLTPVDARGWWAVGLLTLFPTLLGHAGFTLCLGQIPITILSLGKLIEPIFAAIPAYILFGETLSWALGPSTGLIVASVFLIVRDKKK